MTCNPCNVSEVDNVSASQDQCHVVDVLQSGAQSPQYDIHPDTVSIQNVGSGSSCGSDGGERGVCVFM